MVDWLWFKFRKPRATVDEQALYFGAYGEFSPSSDIAFERHLNRLRTVRKRADSIKDLNKVEPLQYWRL